MKTITEIPKKKDHSDAGWFYLLLFILLLIAGWLLLMRVIDWSNTHELKKQKLVSVTLRWPLAIVKKEPQVIEKRIEPYPEELIDTPIKKYIAEKFGPYDAKIALGIVAAESNFNSEAWNVNSNGSIDLGLWQINSVHFAKAGCSIRDVLDPIRATDCAYNLFKEQGFSPWTVFNNGAFLGHL